MHIVSWNCRGLGNPIKAEAVKDLMRMAPSKILLLQETKIEEEALILLSKNKWKSNAGKVVNARGACGGLATLWCEETFKLKNLFANQHWIFQSYIISPVRPLLPSLISMYQLIILKKKNAGIRYQTS